ncbi:hypothetical protein HOY80DRAFT_1058749 [Tuber brumale]|nr:hypothetical protein HOY80DRAFT_1058749 [Tuber brumale]
MVIEGHIVEGAEEEPITVIEVPRMRGVTKRKKKEEDEGTRGGSSCFIDTRCSRHMNGDRSLFVEYKAFEKNECQVEVSDNHLVEVEEVGKISLRLVVFGVVIPATVHNILLVPLLGTTLISHAQLGKARIHVEHVKDYGLYLRVFGLQDSEVIYTSTYNISLYMTQGVDSQRFVWSDSYFVAPLKSMLEAFKAFQDYDTTVIKHWTVRAADPADPTTASPLLFIPKLRTDSDGEYTSQDFTEYLSHHGIEAQVTTSYSLKSNGVKGVATVTYLENCSPTRGLEDLKKYFHTAFENWFERVPEKTKKLDKRSEKSVFVG